LDLVAATKRQLMKLRNDGWDSFFKKVSDFCLRHRIPVPVMSEPFVPETRSTRKLQPQPNDTFYRVGLFIKVIDHQVSELNARFNDESTELLRFASCLDPRDSFAAFDVDKLCRLAKLYPLDFSKDELTNLPYQLDNYFEDISKHEAFIDVKGVGQLAQLLVKVRKHVSYPLVYRLITLVLTLPVSTASVERAFSAMNIIKSDVRTNMNDEWLNSLLMVFIERDTTELVSNEEVMSRYQTMRPRRGRID